VINAFWAWAIFWVSMGLLPCVVAARRLTSGRRFRWLNKWILRTGLAQLLLPLALIGISPLIGKDRQLLGIGLLSWGINFVAMWLLFLGLGLACLFWPRRTIAQNEPVDAMSNPVRVSMASVMLGFFLLIAGALANLLALGGFGWGSDGLFLISLGMIVLGTKLVLRAFRLPQIGHP